MLYYGNRWQMIDILIHAKNVKYFYSVGWKYWKIIILYAKMWFNKLIKLTKYLAPNCQIQSGRYYSI
jgi:hypothetical protein